MLMNLVLDSVTKKLHIFSGTMLKGQKSVSKHCHIKQLRSLNIASVY